MHKRFLAPLATAGLILAGTTACSDLATTERDDVTQVADDDPQMEAAKATAQRTLPEFLAVLEETPEGVSDIGFKFPLRGNEHIWVDNVARDGDHLTGNLSNHPMQQEWALGDQVRVPLDQVSDWAWRDSEGNMQGRYTTRVLLDRIDPEEAAAIVYDFGW